MTSRSLPERLREEAQDRSVEPEYDVELVWLLRDSAARIEALEQALKAAYHEGFATAQEQCLATTADADDIEPHWQQSLARRALTGSR
jgi:hypothetical protein